MPNKQISIGHVNHRVSD